MSSTNNLEEELKRLGEQLCAEGYQLVEAAQLLEKLREDTQRNEQIKSLRKRVSEYLEKD